MRPSCCCKVVPRDLNQLQIQFLDLQLTQNNKEGSCLPYTHAALSVLTSSDTFAGESGSPRHSHTVQGGGNESHVSRRWSMGGPGCPGKVGRQWEKQISSNGFPKLPNTKKTSNPLNAGSMRRTAVLAGMLKRHFQFVLHKPSVKSAVLGLSKLFLLF